MIRRALFYSLLFLILAKFSGAQTILDFKTNKESPDKLVIWKNKGFALLNRSKTMTIFRFINSEGLVMWERTINNDEYNKNRSTSMFATNSKHVYFMTYTNDKTGVHLHLYTMDEKGELKHRESQYDHYAAVAAEVTEGGAILALKDNAKDENEASNENRIVSFEDETGLKETTTDIQLPGGKWSSIGVFNNTLAFKKGSLYGYGDEKDTICFLNSSGKLENLIGITMVVPPGQEIADLTGYIFDEDAQCIYTYFTSKIKDTWYANQLNLCKFDMTGKLVYSAVHHFDDFLAFDEAFPKKIKYKNNFTATYQYSFPAWKGLVFVLHDKYEKSKYDAVILIDAEGKLKQVTVHDHFFINEKYFIAGGYLYGRDGQNVDLGNYPTMITATVKPGLVTNPEVYSRIATMKGADKKPVAYYTVVPIGNTSLIIEYFPGDALMKIYK